MVKRLAGNLNLYQLDEVEDSEDKLLSKLFMKKLEFLFEDKKNMLNRCEDCNSLFSNNQREWMTCSKARVFIDFHGNVV
jgi:hypothetical protein